MRWFPWVALALSLGALGVSVWKWQQTASRADSAEEALLREQSLTIHHRPAEPEVQLRQREQSLVDKHRPTVVKLCRMFGVDPPKDARTIDELMGPLDGIVAGLSK
jgi:hypothetical protein